MKALIFILILTITFCIRMKKLTKKFEIFSCSGKTNGKSCFFDVSCQSYYCSFPSFKCISYLDNGEICRCDAECKSGTCEGNAFGLKYGKCS